MANLTTAQESYSKKRSEFVSGAQDQIENGVYQTEEEEKKILDPLSGEEVTKIFKIIKKRDGIPLRQPNPLEGLGITISNFEVKDFVYSDTVKEQIKTQQEALMGVETSRAKAKQAEQEKITIIEQGKARVEQARYEEEEKKARAVVAASQSRDVAQLHRDAAVFSKEKDILLGQGEATRKKLVMEADGALEKKLATYERVMENFAKEFGKQKWVPEISMSGSADNKGNAAINFMEILGAKAARDLSLDIGVQKK
jgi:regulator of protease activity HflC (stomatin/prohibitin superfamily)